MRLERSCAGCGGAFLARSWALARGWDHCCSRVCARRWRYSPSRRFWRCVQQTDTCWLWTGPRTSSGAGYFRTVEGGRRRRRRAAVLVWEDAYGPVPAGHVVRPRCGQAACVRPEHLGLRRASTRPIEGRPDHRLASVCAHPRPLFWTRERVTAALARFHRQTGQAPTSSNAWRAVSNQLAHGRSRSFPSPTVVLRYFGSFRAAWASIGIELPTDGAPWTEREDSYLRSMTGVMTRNAIARALGRSSDGVKARLGRLRRQLRNRAAAGPAAPEAPPDGRGAGPIALDRSTASTFTNTHDRR